MTDLSDRRVRAVAADDTAPHSYFVFTDGRLLRVAAGSTRAESIVEVPNIREAGHGTGDGRLEGKPLEVRLYVHGPWVCVTERFGTNAALINTTDRTVRELTRADYHSDVSSYSVGFVERAGRTLLIAQTEWNRLDAFDAETGANLTEREVSRSDTEETNYIDYFHSLIHVSPDTRHFLSNGWVWSPVDMVRVFSTEAFLTGYEPTSVPVSTAFGYNWDRPATFIDDHTFVLALDEDVDEDRDEDRDEDDGARPYHQLAYFDVPDPSAAEDAGRWLEPRELVDCDVFARNQYGEVKGELHYDPESGHLIALTSDNGTHVLSSAGEIVAHFPDLNLATPPSHGDFGSAFSGSGGWSYAPRHRMFHRWIDGSGIEERPLPTDGRR
ncbi:hypothetical protein [Actinoplanes sichuanensis]|uniref:Uncharacterized protein n=1 Tax=Actinoplanes sichuanensis TaxID=512349 RepID=A0ABW4AWY7_9ACTN|nr:hypothetical protein [Actinoplanes sichuanensis]